MVNGLSGVSPWFIEELSRQLTARVTPFPAPEAQTALRRIYPLRYLVVRLEDDAVSRAWRALWRRVRHAAPPILRFVGTFGSEDLYRIEPLPEQGVRLERWVSYDYLRTNPVLTLALGPRVTAADVEQWVELSLNGRPVRRVPLDPDAALTLTLSPPFLRARPNVVALDYRYARPAAARDARYRIGGTGVVAPGDLRVVSVGQPHGSASSVQLNGVELAPNRRGYNLVALDRSGRIVKAGAFDTFLRAEAAPQLVAWVASLEPGTIVAGAVRDEGSGRLTDAAVLALRQLGVAGDLRGHFREAHAFIGVKGAPPGTALEALGPRPIEVSVGRIELVAGRQETRLGLELTAFALGPQAR